MIAQRKSTKGERTKALILDTAIELFKQKGYEETTMRLIAERAGVALGNAYYYFPSKEHLVQGFYSHLQAQQMEAVEPILEKERNFKNRLGATVLVELSSIEPYHRLSAVLFKYAADPESPLSPFGEESQAIRRRAVQVYERLVNGSSESFPEDLRKELPQLLWLFKMGVILFWIHDRSFGRHKTHELVQRSVELISNLVGIISMPVLMPVRKKLLSLVEKLKESSMPWSSTEDT